MIWYPSVDKTIKGCNNLQNVVKHYNHFLFVVKNFYCDMVLT